MVRHRGAWSQDCRRQLCRQPAVCPKRRSELQVVLLQPLSAHTRPWPTHLRDIVISMATEGLPVLGSRLSYFSAGSVAVKGSVGSNRLVCRQAGAGAHVYCWRWAGGEAPGSGRHMCVLLLAVWCARGGGRELCVACLPAAD